MSANLLFEIIPDVPGPWHGETSTGVAWSVYQGDALEVLKDLPDRSHNCCVTSPPYYWLRDYGVDNQIGQEETVMGYVKAISDVMNQVYRVLNDDGLLFLNLGD